MGRRRKQADDIQVDDPESYLEEYFDTGPKKRPKVVKYSAFKHDDATRDQTKQEPPPPPVWEDGPLENDYGYEFADEEVIYNQVRRKGKSQHQIFHDWLRKFKEYMDLIVQSEAPALGIKQCGCQMGRQAEYRCSECFSSPLLCSECISLAHQYNPFHRIQFWNGNFFESRSLSRDLGVKLLMHHDGLPCPKPSLEHDLTVIHSNGFHSIPVIFCQCDLGTTHDLQLFSAGLFPASVMRPQTAFTFQVLENFRIHHLEGKGSAFSYMESLSRISGIIGDETVKNRSREFQRVAREWNFLQACKSAGRYGDFGDWSLAELCPACPHPGLNMPANWKVEIDVDQWWLYRLFIHFDANFRLVLHKAPRASGDLSLWEGLGYFVDREGYTKYLATVDSIQQEPSDCVDHKAVAQKIKSRFGTLDVTGVAGGVCRHECAIPNIFVNLHRGERYVNSDYALSSAFTRMGGIREVVLSYDIACQYSRHFHQRFNSSRILNLPNFDIKFLIPKFHLPAHQEACRFHYSLNYSKGVGRTDGEAIERFWSTHNHLSGSTSKMTPGARLDTLNLHIRDWNVRKSINMGRLLNARLSKALVQVNQHTELFNELCETLDEDVVASWIGLEDTFQSQYGVRTIYQVEQETAPTQAQILLQLAANEDENDIRREYAAGFPALRAAHWINEGISIEESQRALAIVARGVNTGSTEKQQIDFRRRRAGLRTRILAWHAHAPYDAGDDSDNSGSDDDDDQGILPEVMKIRLPSNVEEGDRSDELAGLELQLRTGEAHDALKALRTTLSQRIALLRTKGSLARGIRENTRAARLVARADAAVTRAANSYRASRTAMVRLGMNEDESIFRVLREEDINTRSVFDRNRGPGIGAEGLSWIWRVHNSLVTPIGDGELMGEAQEAIEDSWMKQIIRVQFMDVKANRDRWAEEVKLLRVELQRTRQYFMTLSERWRVRADGCHTTGEKAHALKLAAEYRGRGESVYIPG